ncbi:MAG: tetratricopeptide repeat protein [Bradyrhizobium sp.]|jgi:tetratricopeptide (TPR) repeat protein|uniref:tetratricopeptide repeat protein n=1 Tax=Bradyrhizobium sp. TaxID=376 RepID=UPI00121623C8|nr:tetratricopeptide repeat protein [Bradyrhizobium sp.]THD56197.1 MAG: tetratricopeptide repeat protein [Bradyrhizobium sp.]
MNLRQRRAASSKSGAVPNGTDARSPAVLCDLARRLLFAGQPTEAVNRCQHALTIDPDHAASLCLMGEICLHSGQLDQAVEWVTRAISIDPKVDYVATLGTVLQRSGRLTEALKAFEKAISIEPENAELWKNFGAILIDLNHPDHALLGLQQALKLRPRYVEAANLSGLILYRQERHAEALEFFNLSLEVEPAQADALQVRALVFLNLKRFEEALADNHQSQLFNPGDADTHNNLATTLQKLGRYADSVEWYDRAIALRPNFVLALNGRAHSLIELRRTDEALTCYARSIALDPENPEARWDMALLQMLVGNFEAGWVGREGRWKLGIMRDPRFSQPLWLGNGSIEGKTILLYADEGLGDMFQFARYIPMVASLGARVIAAVADPACSLMSRLDGVAECIPKSMGALPAFDIHCPISSLPLAFKTAVETIPSAVPYLPTPAVERIREWEGRLGAHDKFRVGLVWSGNAGHINDHNRSMPLRELTGILDLDATFVSLQKDLRDRDREVLASTAIVDLTQGLSDFDETSALVSCLDLAITVDTSVAHLAGGLGCPVWILLPYTPDYRWMLDREDSPWYPTARLFRQAESREWSGVLERMRVELGALIEDWRHRSAQM